MTILSKVNFNENRVRIISVIISDSHIDLNISVIKVKEWKRLKENNYMLFFSDAIAVIRMDKQLIVIVVVLSE